VSEHRPRAVGLLGGGVIGAGWAARFLLNGVDVRLHDPDPRAADGAREVLASARRAYDRLTLAPLPAEGTLTVCTSLEDAVDDVDLVQESAPEQLELKRSLLAAADRATASRAVICSSTSGLRPTELQVGMEHPERLVVGHPFNPVYLLPLVEVCGGAATASETIERAAAAYRSVGMQVLHVRTEIDGFVADRLLEALWREALWLVHDDVATVGEIDDAVRFGAGLRWAFMGTFLTYRIAGGEAGMRHFMSQFGPALAWPWSKLTDVPELTDALLDKLVAQSDAQASGRSIRELERERDDALVAVLQGLRGTGTGAGETLLAWERDLLARGGAADVRAVPASWVDYNGHVHESRYLEAFGDATDALLGSLGLEPAVGSYFTAETHLSHLRQLHAGDRFRVTTQVLETDEKRLHVFHVLLRDGESDPVATAEQMLLYVDTATGRVSAVNGALRERVERLRAEHASLPRPERAGRSVGAR
jgi:carnitine 3-dehydrogenase / betainyl-CoA thioesterase